MTAHKTTGEMKARIRDEATKLFGQRGYSETPLDAVAKAVGIRKALQWHGYCLCGLLCR